MPNLDSSVNIQVVRDGAAPETRRPRGPYAPGARRREAILDAAIELWSEAGSNGAGLAAIAKRAGTTHSVLLHHFGSKANLLVEVIAERQRRSAADADRTFAGDGAEPSAICPCTRYRARRRRRWPGCCTS